MKHIPTTLIPLYFLENIYSYCIPNFRSFYLFFSIQEMESWEQNICHSHNAKNI